MDKTFTDVRIFHPHAPTNAKMAVAQMYRHHEHLKKRAYNARVLQVEKGTFTPLVFSTTGGMCYIITSYAPMTRYTYPPIIDYNEYDY